MNPAPIPRSSSASHFRTVSAPQLPHEAETRSKIVGVLAETANGCLTELGYYPGIFRELSHYQNTTARWQEENVKLFQDNNKLVQNYAAAQSQSEQLLQNNRALEQRYSVLEKRFAGLQDAVTKAPGSERIEALVNENKKLAKMYEAISQKYLALEVEYGKTKRTLEKMAANKGFQVKGPMPPVQQGPPPKQQRVFADSANGAQQHPHNPMHPRAQSRPIVSSQSIAHGWAPPNYPGPSQRKNVYPRVMNPPPNQAPSPVATNGHWPQNHSPTQQFHPQQTQQYHPQHHTTPHQSYPPTNASAFDHSAPNAYEQQLLIVQQQQHQHQQQHSRSSLSSSATASHPMQQIPMQVQHQQQPHQRHPLGQHVSHSLANALVPNSSHSPPALLPSVSDSPLNPISPPPPSYSATFQHGASASPGGSFQEPYTPNTSTSFNGRLSARSTPPISPAVSSPHHPIKRGSTDADMNDLIHPPKRARTSELTDPVVCFGQSGLGMDPVLVPLEPPQTVSMADIIPEGGYAPMNASPGMDTAVDDYSGSGSAIQPPTLPNFSVTQSPEGTGQEEDSMVRDEDEYQYGPDGLLTLACAVESLMDDDDDDENLKTCSICSHRHSIGLDVEPPSIFNNVSFEDLLAHLQTKHLDAFNHFRRNPTS